MTRAGAPRTAHRSAIREQAHGRSLGAQARFSYLDLGEEELPSESQKVSESVRHEDSRSHGGSVPKTKRAHRDDVFVGCNLFVRHPDPGSKRGWSMASPDLFVAFGMPPRRQRPRRSFVVWRQEGRKQDIVLEIASKKTRRRDAKEKPGVYAGLGVREHFLYDPDGVLRPELQGFAYCALPEAILSRGARGGRSEALAPDPRVAGEKRELRWRHPDSGQFLRTYQESEARGADETAAREAAENRAAAAEGRASRKTTARTAAEAEIARLRHGSRDH